MFGRKFASWYIFNTDTEDKIEGQFPPEDVTQEMNVSYAESTALNRQHPVIQFLHGNAERVSFTGKLFAENSSVNLLKPLRMLQSWTKRDPALLRPPILRFWIGDYTINFNHCVLDSLSGIKYHDFREDGSPRHITFTISLLEYYDFSYLIEEGGETRYHRAKEHDYYERIAEREYGNPMLGVEIRTRHPTQPNLELGDIVKLPSAEIMRGIVLQPKSIALNTAFGRKDTSQRRLRNQVFDRLNVDYTSHIIKE